MAVRSMLAGLVRAGTGGNPLLKGWQRGVSFSAAVRCEAEEVEESMKLKKGADRTNVIPVETSIKYMQSEAYQAAYGDDPVWKKYRRNFKGQFAPKQTRKTCIRGGVITTGNACPVCRDEYLVLHPANTALLKQFISPHNQAILPTSKTNICRMRQKQLTVAIQTARDTGLLTFDVPFRHYHYPEYYPPAAAADSTSTSTAADSTSTSTAATSVPPTS